MLISAGLLVSGLPLKLLPNDQQWNIRDAIGLVAMVSFLVSVMLPLDLLGGYFLPNRSRPGTMAFAAFAGGWTRGILVQATFFVFVGLIILAAGRGFGLPGACAAILLIGLVQVAFQLQIARLTASLPERVEERTAAKTVVDKALQQTSQWGWKRKPIVVLEHHDTGFTGGVVGLPGLETVIVPAASLTELTPEQLAITIARRLESIRSGSRTRGVILAFAWVIIGFGISASLPGAGVESVAELAMTCCGFTLWSFVGLLTLPTLSRQASYAIDRELLKRDANPETFYAAIQRLDRLQDDEPKRSAVIETIFHPVPSVENRRRQTGNASPIAWHAARMTLCISWACMGMLVRAVHCNVGRPELWVMLPTD